MRILRLTLFLMGVSALGCAGSQPVHVQLSPAARIGILNVLEPQMTHVDVGALRFDGFTRAYDVDWNIPEYMSRAIETDLNARGAYTFIPLAVNAPADWKQSTATGILSAVKGWMPGDLEAFLKQTAAENRLDLIISVSSYDSGAWQQDACFDIAQNAVVTKGYGLYTRKKVLSAFSNLLPVGQNTATPYANIIVAIFRPQPLALAAYGRAPCSKSALPDFPWADDMRFLSPTVLRELKPHVERLGAEAARTALANAGLGS
jgi:hypothetical protein